MTVSLHSATRNRLLAIVRPDITVVDSLLAAEQKRPIAALLTAHDAEQDSIGLDPIIVALLEAGSDYFVCFGRASESLHDRIDEIVVVGLPRRINAARCK